MAKLQLIEGGRSARGSTADVPLDHLLRQAPPAPGRVSAAAGAIEHLDMAARAREVPPDATERLDPVVMGGRGQLTRKKLEQRVRVALERFRTARPRLRLTHVERFTPGVQAHIEELARRHARELVLRVRDGGADDSSVPIEVEVILEICSWFEVLGKLKSEAGMYRRQ